MGIKLSDFIKDPHNVFTQEEAEMIYLAVGYVDLGNECYLEQTSRIGEIKMKEVVFIGSSR